MFDIEETLKFLLKGTSGNDEEALRKKLTEVYNEGRTLRIKFGMDPSGTRYSSWSCCCIKED